MAELTMLCATNFWPAESLTRRVNICLGAKVAEVLRVFPPFRRTQKLVPGTPEKRTFLMLIEKGVKTVTYSLYDHSTDLGSF